MNDRHFGYKQIFLKKPSSCAEVAEARAINTGTQIHELRLESQSKLIAKTKLGAFTPKC
jgi:hypothetical protein